MANVNEIELNELSSRRVVAPASVTVEDPVEERVIAARDSAISVWALAGAVAFASAAATLILFPRFLLFAAETSADVRNVLTPLEAFLALHSGIFLLALSLALILNIPSSSPILPRQDPTEPQHPLLVPLTVGCALSSWASYYAKDVGPLALVVCITTSTLCLWGLWVMAFAGTSRFSRKTGADKHTSRFLFGNKAAASTQKKEWKREQRKLH
ncbi:hypothetical protein PUNSTDRAFT_121454 [Punctularia strigosozonata HHB-11173 SS5]|uniref:uncharacterized protein n=1 Tax=Punctularia strigosozonata (strain HHB-11173) TaxID=741275 RepID=UPI0004417CA0|nr:uncharacterized protein PUNSTDRAFT_121454 [Punctularia strigosozonata HHB-11173 SS5]EIN07300.1 hypothetical protein PUNSTDRAFT_121454 [Punctularia strigosozonata HHB-11173 SS5]